MNIEHNMHDILGQTKTAGQSIRKRYAAFFSVLLVWVVFSSSLFFHIRFFVLSFSLLLINWASSIPLSSHLSHCPMSLDHSMIWSSMNIDNKANQKIENIKKKKIIGIFTFFNPFTVVFHFRKFISMICIVWFESNAFEQQMKMLLMSKTCTRTNYKNIRNEKFDHNAIITWRKERKETWINEEKKLESMKKKMTWREIKTRLQPKIKIKLEPNDHFFIDKTQP